MYKSHKIKIGGGELGGDSPVRIQSMTSTDTSDTLATVEQCIRIIREGADFVRVTVRNFREAENLRNIKKALAGRGFNTPLIADVHFNHKIAEVSAGIADKVRINPGNFAGENFSEIFSSFLQICKKNRTAVRIGVNHGSLSERIMERLGDTPEGMVESAMEYLRICVKEDFNDGVVSIKSSNTRIMIAANRLLVETMMKEDMDFPVHLGITEAGEGEDGRLRSAVGIGTLLGEGIGDTIRISLTEDPEKEIPVARKLVSIFKDYKNTPDLISKFNQLVPRFLKSTDILNKSKFHVPVVISSAYGFRNSGQGNEILPDYIYTDSPEESKDQPEGIYIITDPGNWKLAEDKDRCFPLFNLSQLSEFKQRSPVMNFIQLHPEEITKLNISDFRNDPVKYALIIRTDPVNLHSLFNDMNQILRSGYNGPLIIHASLNEKDPELFLLKAASLYGRFFVDRMTDGIWLENPHFSSSETTRLAFGLLQASRVRMTRTEYIACPSCGRTLFNIQETLASVKAATSHLKHLKIAVMGCIVNGPGEMADADYGFVGSSAGKVTLFRQHKAVKKNIPAENAIDELITLIRREGDWIDL